MADRGDPPRVRELLSDVTARFGIARAPETGALWARWRSIVGDVVADHAEPISLRDGTLSIRAESPSWASEVGYLAREIKARVNAALGAEIVRDIRVSAGPLRARRRRPTAPAKQPATAAESEPAPAADVFETFERVRRAWLRRRAMGR